MAFDAAMFNTLKDIRKEHGDQLAALIAEQQRTNQLLEQLIQVSQGQPRVFHPQGAPWQEPAHQ